MRFNVLGPLVVLSADGVDVTPAGVQQRRLLTALVTAAPSPVSVSQLTDLLWPDGAPSANALQAQVSKLRSRLDGVAIVRDGTGYALRPAPGDVRDLAEFDSLISRGAAAVAENRYPDAAADFSAALALLRGEPLEDLVDSDVGRGERARIVTLVSTARAGRIEAAMAIGRLGEAVAELERLVVTEPLDERWWALLMTALYRQGRHADALRAYGRARRVLAEELGLEPGPELQTIERQVLVHAPTLSDLGAARPGPAVIAPDSAGRATRVRSLPARLSSLVGRDELLAELATEVDRHRLVSLVGPGGVGKTSVAIELARRVSGRAVVLIELAAVADADQVGAVVADGLGLAGADVPTATAGASALERVVEALNAAPTLLVFDNCEHLVDAVAKLVHRLLEECPQLSIVATSREVLGVPGEAVRAVPPLGEDAALALLTDRAAAVAPDIDFDVAATTVARAVCDRLDRLPLAIELAAARLRSLSLDELFAGLDDRFRLLASGSRTLEPRQQTLRAVVEWSHDLLDEQERTVFRRLAVFRGGATLAAAEQACSDDTIPSHAVGGVLERLIDKSLLIVERHQDVSRFSMLQTLAEYAAERLRDAGELDAVALRHAGELAARLAPARRGLLGPEQQRWIRLIAAERDNVRAALDVAMRRGDGDLALRLTAPLGWYFYMVAQAEFGVRALEDALACPGSKDATSRATVLANYGWLAANGPRLDVALDATAEAVDLLGEVDDAWLETFVYATRIMALIFGGRIDDAFDAFTRADEAARRSNDRWAQSLVEVVRGEVAQLRGDAGAAEKAFAAAVAGLEAVGDEFALTIALTEAAETAEMRGHYDDAAGLLTKAIEISERVGFSGMPLAMRARLANVEILRGDLATAERLHRELLDDVVGESLPWVRALSGVGLGMLGRRTGRLDEAESWLADAWERSRTRDVPVMRALVLSARGYTADQRGDHETALAFQLDGLTTATTYPGPRVLANALEGVAGALAAGPVDAHHELAARLLGAADALRRRSGGPMPLAERFDVVRAEGRVRRTLGEARFDALFSTGAGTSVDVLVAEASALRG